MQANYKLSKGIVFIPEVGFVKTYGIIGNNGIKKVHIEDISDVKEKVEELVTVLNDNDVALVHFPYIIDDWLVK